MHSLWLYRWLSRFDFMNYRAKIMVMAFIGTHIPLITLASYFALQSAPDWKTFVATVGITLLATLLGTGLTLFVLNELLRPVIMTSRALRAYREERRTSDLPTGFADEVGTLMADATLTIDHLEATREALEYVDETTGLPNRKRLAKQLAARIGREEAFTVAVLRFANYDRIVETMDLKKTEAAGAEIGRRVSAELAGGEALARAGRSDFAWVVEGADTQTGWTATCARLARLIEDCAADIEIDGIAVKPVLHAGLAAFPQDASDAETLVDFAAAAAGQAVDEAPVVLHSPEARYAALDRFRLEQELRRAIDRNEFDLHYQPVVNLASGRAVGAEALIRWQHPERGLIMPGAFIPAAEASGLIDPIGLWVIRRACDQLRHWNESGMRDMKLAVNLSARQFLDPDLKWHLTEAITSSGIGPNQLEIELTETAAMADHEHTKRVFSMMRDIGVSIAIDDFGTGYAGMSYLRKLPFDKLKIDREFVSDVHRQRDAQAICGALVELSRGLGLEVLAEGTETEEEARYLGARGCNLFQGYYFARPQPADAFEATVNALPLRELLSRMKAPDSAKVAEGLAKIG